MTNSNTIKAIPASWKVTGRGKTASYFAAVKPSAAVKPGAVVALKAKSGAITYGRLNSPAVLSEKVAAEIPTGTAVWTFDRATDLMSAELRAENAALKADARAAFLRSDAGIKQAERIAARAEKRAADDAAGIPDTSTVTTTVDPTIMVPAATEQPEQPAGPTMGEVMAGMRAAGFTAAEVLAAIAGNPPTDVTPAAAVKPARTRAPRQTAPAAPAAVKPISLATLNAKAGTRGK